MTDLVGHSGRNVSNGEPVHVQRTAHPLFNTPNSLSDPSLWRKWSLRYPWHESAEDNGPLPNNSPAASGVSWALSAPPAAGTPTAQQLAAQWERNARTSRQTLGWYHNTGGDSSKQQGTSPIKPIIHVFYAKIHVLLGILEHKYRPPLYLPSQSPATRSRGSDSPTARDTPDPGQNPRIFALWIETRLNY